MLIEKREKEVYIELEGGESREFIDIVQNDALMWDNLIFYHSRWDGWQYLYDVTRDQICFLTDYAFDRLEELVEEGNITLVYIDNDDDFIDYEWNV